MDPEKLREFLREGMHSRHHSRLISRRTGTASQPSSPSILRANWPDMDPILHSPSDTASWSSRTPVRHMVPNTSRKGKSLVHRRNRWDVLQLSALSGKNLGACGEAGAVTTNDAELAQKVRNAPGSRAGEKYHHEIEDTMAAWMRFRRACLV